MNAAPQRKLPAALTETLCTALTLLVFSVVSAALLAGAYRITRIDIERSEQQEKIRLLSQVLPSQGFDNDPIRDAHTLAVDALLGLKRPSQAFVATRNGQAVAVVLEAAAPDGYAGEIRLLVGIDASGRLIGVRVTSHKETPGLGDYIEAGKSAWIRQFAGRSLDTPDAEGWQVRKDGGRFDYVAGATITPRAVVKAVHKTLRYFAAHRQTLLRPPHAPKGAPP
ncbi:MAG TPA: electron transport complex subunit RsxG [Thiobacillaceae bacterium]|nr:electron transport complex subunit RsxG [Thiobacillaceae bacterium]HNU63169.1 electron transport complex subunit RsxG [Thiobacillaceae bacterium]